MPWCISYAVHVPYYTTRILRENGYHADYLSIGKSFHWKNMTIFAQCIRYGVIKEFYWCGLCWQNTLSFIVILCLR